MGNRLGQEPARRPKEDSVKSKPLILREGLSVTRHHTGLWGEL